MKFVVSDRDGPIEETKVEFDTLEEFVEWATSHGTRFEIVAPGQRGGDGSCNHNVAHEINFMSDYD